MGSEGVSKMPTKKNFVAEAQRRTVTEAWWHKGLISRDTRWVQLPLHHGLACDDYSGKEFGRDGPTEGSHKGPETPRTYPT